MKCDTIYEKTPINGFCCLLSIHHDAIFHWLMNFLSLLWSSGHLSDASNACGMVMIDRWHLFYCLAAIKRQDERKICILPSRPPFDARPPTWDQRRKPTRSDSELWPVNATKNKAVIIIMAMGAWSVQISEVVELRPQYQPAMPGCPWMKQQAQHKYMPCSLFTFCNKKDAQVFFLMRSPLPMRKRKHKNDSYLN